MVTTADSNYVKNSNINISLASTSFSSSAGIAICTNTSAVTGAGNNGNKNIIDNNAITGGYFGIAASGTNSTTFCKRNELTNNRINGAAYYGIYFQYQDSCKENGNTIDNMLATNTGSYGLYNYYVEHFEIKKNRINRVGQYGMYLNNMNYQLGSGTDRSEMSNNMIGGIFYAANPNAIYVPGQMRNVDIWHNTANVVNAGSSTGPVWYSQQTTAGYLGGLDFRNNTFTCTNFSGSFAAYNYWTSSAPMSTINDGANGLESPSISVVTVPILVPTLFKFACKTMQICLIIVKQWSNVFTCCCT